MESIVLTLENNRLHLAGHAGIRAVRIDRLVWETDESFTQHQGFDLAIIDEANLVLWREALFAFINPNKPNEANISREFAVWESLTLQLIPPDTKPGTDFRIRLFYTLNPDSSL